MGNSIYLFLKDKLKLPINREKSGIRKPVQFEILGYKFVPTYIKGERGKYQLTVSEKSWETLKRKLKNLTKKTTPKTFGERIRQLKEVQRGWLNYFRMGSIYGKLKELDSWVRNRLRKCIWHDWKKPERKRKNLIRLGVDKGHAYAWSRTRMGGWAVAQSPILITTITLKRLEKRGYLSMLDYYLQNAPQLNEPLYLPAGRQVRDPYIIALKQYRCERHTPLVNSGGAAYSISRWLAVRSKHNCWKFRQKFVEVISHCSYRFSLLQILFFLQDILTFFA